MSDLRGNLRLRPTRIGFLVSPSDRQSIRRIMRINASLWGGQYNPIVPVFQKTPKDWVDPHSLPIKGREITQGYIKFFEPDVYVEAKKGYYEKAGLSGLRRERYDGSVTGLDEFFENEFQGLYDPAFGLSVYDILDDTYVSERRFQLRDNFPAIYSDSEDIFAEACIGVYPNDNNINYLKKVYEDVYRPELTKSTPETWLKIYNHECATPFSVTDHKLDVWRSWHNEPIIYIFDQSKTIDIIDLWNLRIQSSQIFPVPINWLNDLKENLCNFIKAHHRPIRSNPNGVMHRTTVEKSRSISEERSHDEILPCFDGLPSGSFSIKLWRTRVWNVNYDDSYVSQPTRLEVTADERDQTLAVKNEGYRYADIITLSPSFSRKFSGSRKRWANVLTLSSPYGGTEVALCLPHNTFDRGWPFQHHGEFINSREGWIFLNDFKSLDSSVSFLSHEEAFTNWFEKLGIQSELSDPGRIARQMIESLDGFWGLYLVDDKHSLQLINKSAMSTRKREKGKHDALLEEDFSGRTASIKQWKDMIQKRKAGGAHHLVEIEDYVKRNIIKIGLESECTHCHGKNWHSLDEISYLIKCSRCLKEYEFPQSKLKRNNENWRYRVIGPFAVPDYAQGAYSSLLTIRFFTTFRDHDAISSYSTALNLTKGDEAVEVDFSLWISDQRGHKVKGDPKLIIGEAKSFGQEVIKNKDINQLKKAAEFLPGSILVISVLKDGFSGEELKILKKFVLWARQPNNYQPRHHVILLTATELFNQHLESTWKDKGKPHSDFADFHFTKNLESLSDATQAIYLGLKPYHQWLEDEGVIHKMPNKKN